MCPGGSLAGAVEAMKSPGAAEGRRLVGLLEEALVREARLWKVPVFRNGSIQVRLQLCIPVQVVASKRYGFKNTLAKNERLLKSHSNNLWICCKRAPGGL